jgi:hypothetical protein
MLRNICLTGFFVLGLLACTNNGSTVDQASRSSAMKQAVVIAVASPQFDLPAGAKLAWLEDMLVVHDKDRDLSMNLVLFLQNEIQQQLRARGYQFVANADDAKYLLAAVAVLGDAMTSEDMARAFKLHPSLISNQDYEKGTLLMGLLNPRTKKAEWRGVIQMFADTNLPGETRKARGEMAVARLLSKLPQ